MSEIGMGVKSRWLNIVSICVVILTMSSGYAVARKAAYSHRSADAGFQELELVEIDESISSINIRNDDWWANLWQGYFLMKKKHYFEISTYHGFSATPLEGDWDLVNLDRAGQCEVRWSNDSFALVRAGCL